MNVTARRIESFRVSGPESELPSHRADSLTDNTRNYLSRSLKLEMQ